MNLPDSLNSIKEALTRREQSIAVAESVTSGLLQSVLASTEEASRFFQGGITAYNIGQKCRHLDIDPVHSLSCNCVSEKVAQDMALGVCKLFTSNWGIGITGYSTPVPESDNKLFAYFSIVCDGQIMHLEKLEAVISDPQKVQSNYVNKIIETLEGLLVEPETGSSDPQPVSDFNNEVLGLS